MTKDMSRDDLNLISMQVILHAGNARDISLKIMENMAEENPNFEQVDKLIIAAHKELALAHAQQTSMIQLEAKGKLIPYSVLFVHSQDTLMTIQSELILIERLVPIIHRIGGDKYE